ncbi:MAG TPA: hypothetical protein VHE35_28480, partial [Kofleriaceae bacterium]|nr:hypothetical protein [Kofleriaceae bacterium]
APAPAPAPAKPARPRRPLGRRLVRWLGATIVGLAVAFLLAECGLRIAGVGHPIFHQPDATYGLVLIPGAGGTYTQEGRAAVHVNAAGFRDVDHPLAKPPGTLRLAVLGGSTTEALQVARTDAFWSLLADDLHDCPAAAGRQVEAMSFGVDGYSTATSLLLLRNRVWAWHPDVVLLAFQTSTDVANNSPALGAEASPFYRLDGGQLVLDGSRARGLGAGGRAALWLVRHSRVLELVNQARVNLHVCGRLRACAPELAVDADADAAGRRSQVYVEPRDDAWRDAWQVTEALLAAMRDEAAAHQARFFLVSLTNGIQVHPDPEVREQFRRALGVADLSYPDRRLGELAARDHIPFLALAPVFAARVDQDHRYYHGFPGASLGRGHWNRDGHRLAADTIAPWLCQELSR